MLTERVKKRLEATKKRPFPICTEKVSIMIPSFERNAGLPAILRRAKAVADYLDNRTIRIFDGELIVGNIAKEEMGMECRADQPTWPDDDRADLLSEGNYTMTEEDVAFLKTMNSYYINTDRSHDVPGQEHQNKMRTKYEAAAPYYDDERIWPFIHRGFLVPAWKAKYEGRGMGGAGIGWGLNLSSTILFCPDYEKVLREGVDKQVEEAKECLRNLRYDHWGATQEADYWNSIIIEMSAFSRTGARFAKLATEMAAVEKDPVRKAELEQIAEICTQVPAKPARNFREAIQSMYFYWVLLAAGGIPGGRFDQYMYPYYKADLEAGKITREEALELIELLRVKIQEFSYTNGGKAQREKYAGEARWHNFILGGCDKTGKESSNEITYLFIEAAMECKNPHPTCTLRVNNDTPRPLLRKAMECIGTGIGMPALISEQGYMDFCLKHGATLEDARNFAIGGCIDVVIPGKARNCAYGMMNTPLALDLVMHRGHSPKDGPFFSYDTGDFGAFETFDDFYAALLKHLDWMVELVNEEHNIQLETLRDIMPDVGISCFLDNGVKCGKDGLSRRMPFEVGSTINAIGGANLINSLAAIKKLCYDDKVITMARLLEAIDANWEGEENEAIRQLCLAVPKYGNDDDYVDEIGARFWHDFAQIVEQYKNIYGAPACPAAISITSHAPGGKLCCATPDGRYAGETYADGSMSPVQGTDTNGPVAVIKSAIKMQPNQFQGALHNIKFTPSTFKNSDDMEKVIDLMVTYLTNGGRQIQFNVVDKETLLAAQKAPQDYRDLVVRVAGFSAYFVTINKTVQGEIIKREAHSF